MICSVEMEQQLYLDSRQTNKKVHKMEHFCAK